MKKKIGFSLVSFIMYMAIVATLISLLLPAVYTLYTNTITQIKIIHKDMLLRKIIHQLKIDFSMAPNEKNLWNNKDQSVISFKDENKKITWKHKNSKIYRIEKIYKNLDNQYKKETSIFLDSVDQVAFFLTMENENIIIKSIIFGNTYIYKLYNGKIV